MSTDLSRRGLFKAFGASTTEASGNNEPVALVARISDACVEPKGVTCRRCGEECEAAAIRFRLQARGRTCVALDADACIGCGACLHVCPVNAISLIAVERAALLAGFAAMRSAP